MDEIQSIARWLDKLVDFLIGKMLDGCQYATYKVGEAWERKSKMKQN
jgi:hypothetical protein